MFSLQPDVVHATLREVGVDLKRSHSRVLGLSASIHTLLKFVEKNVQIQTRTKLLPTSALNNLRVFVHLDPKYGAANYWTKHLRIFESKICL